MRCLAIGCLVIIAASAFGAEVRFAAEPTAKKAGDKTVITFSVSAPTDVEVAVLDAKGTVVRHLAAGVLGGPKPPPAPLASGLAQELTWDGRDDLGKPVPAGAGPFKARVRAGTAFRLGRFIGEDPYVFATINSVATDEDGNLYAMAFAGGLNQNMDTLRVFTPDGKYLRTLIPFSAALEPDRIAAAAAWSDARKAFMPKNLSSQLPQFYPWGGAAQVVSASKSGGIILSHGTNVYRMDLDGGNVRGPFPMWSAAAKVKNPGWNIPQLAASPDGKFIYYSNVAGSQYDTKKPEDIDPKWPQGRVYRQDTAQAGADPQPFFDLQLPDWGAKKYWMPNAWNKRTAAYGVTVDSRGGVYACDLVNQQVVEVGADGKQVSATAAPWPERVHVDARTGAYYVICRLEQPKDGYVGKKLLKISGRGAAAKVVAELPLARWPGLGEASALGTLGGEPVLWLAGGGSVVCLKDKGESLELVETGFKPSPTAQVDWNRIAVDFARDEVYTSDGGSRIWRYDGKTGSGEILKSKGAIFNGVDLAVGYDGLLYVRTGTSYAGPLERFTRALEPAPFASGSHVLSRYIYSRYGVGNCEKGLGVGPDGQCYISFMYGWNKYLVAGFGPDGKPIKARYLAGVFQPDTKSGAPPELNTAVVGPIHAESGGVRVGLDGDVYVGVRAVPKDFKAPAGYEKDAAYGTWTGSVVRFKAEGGTFLKLADGESKQPEAPRAALADGTTAEGAVRVYPGFAPLSGGGYGGGGSCCVCRAPRFDLDRYGRLVMPNAVTNSVLLLDNAGNLIAEFGAYGNFDSQYVNPNLKVVAGETAKPSVAVPAIPLAWPTGAGLSDDHVYVNDTYNRRIVRVDKSFAAEATAEVK